MAPGRVSSNGMNDPDSKYINMDGFLYVRLGRPYSQGVWATAEQFC